MEHLSLSCLGSFSASLDERPLQHFRTKKVQALLIYLAVEHAAEAAHRRDKLMTLLWPDLPEKSARVNLRQIVYHLRRQIPELATSAGQGHLPFLLSERQTIQINPEVVFDLDVTSFNQLLQANQNHQHVGLLTCHACHERLQAAADLYRGDFLADFYLSDSNVFEEWAWGHRERLRRRALDALDALTLIRTRQGNYGPAQEFARKQLEIDNLRESAYRQLMEALALSGQRSAALVQYELCRRLLREELGMAPTAQTTAVYEHIRAGEMELAAQPKPAARGYELGDEIGTGAFGAVYRAVQPGVGREVAVKIIRPQYANQPDFIRRFEAEAQMVARLEHPHIVPLYDYWREPDGAYLVMRYLRGGSLESALKDAGPWPLSTAVRLIDQVAAALAVAHRQEIVHRDIKPANILLDEEGNAYLSDFGFARAMGSNGRAIETQTIVGSPAYISPEQLSREPVTTLIDLYSLGIVLFQMLAGELPFPDASVTELLFRHLNEPLPLVCQRRPELPTAVDQVIQRATAKRPADRYPDALALAAAFRTAVGDLAPTLPAAAELIPFPPDGDLFNPYMGLRAFQESDADNFFGRDDLVAHLLNRLGDPAPVTPPAAARFLALVGPSGSGKSSVVKAGLIPALRRGALPGSEHWFIVEMTPGSHPLEELAAALLHVAVNPPPSLLAPLQKDARGLVRTVKRILPQDRDAPYPSQLLLLIDQFEELFTLVADDRERSHFLDCLLAAVADPRSRLRVVVTLRADFYDRPLQVAELAELMRERMAIVPPLSPVELEQAITSPAAQVGVGLEPGLAAEMAADVADQPGGLPLLQYALTELFERREGRQMTRAAYEEVGGVLGALGRRAEAIYQGLDDEAREVARQLFLRLVTLGEGAEDTRRRVRRSELEAIQKPGIAEKPGSPVIDAYGRHRLLTFDQDPATRDPTVEVAHEALLREWSRLRGWLDNSREDVRLQRSLAGFAAEWALNDRQDGFLLRGSRLDLYGGWAAGTDIALTPDEQDFLQASLAAREQREAQERARQQRELETAQRLAAEQSRHAEEQGLAARRLRALAAGLAMILLLAVGAAWLAVDRGQEAQANADLAATSEAAAIAEIEQRATAQAQAEEQRAVAEAESQRADSERDAAVQAEATAVAAGQRADEERDNALAAEAAAEEARLAAEEQAKIAFSRELAAAAIASLDDDPERSVLLALHALRETRTQEAEEVLHLTLPHLRVVTKMIGHENDVLQAAFSPDGTRLATAGEDGTARVWDTLTGEELLLLVVIEDEVLFPSVTDIAYSLDGRFIVTAGGPDGLAKVWDAVSGELLHTLSGHLDTPNLFSPGDPMFINTVAISPDSRTIATGADDGLAKLWDAATGAELDTLAISEDVTTINTVEFSPDGSRLLLMGWNPVTEKGVLRIVDLASGAELLTLNGFDIAQFTPDGSRLLIGQWRGNTVHLWDLETGAELTRYRVGDYTRVDFSPDGSLFATGDWDGDARIWETETGREVLKLSGQQDIVWNAIFSPDGSQLVTASADHTAWIWDIGPGHETLTLEPFIAEGVVTVANIAFSPDGTMLAVGALDGRLSIWDPEKGNVLLELAGHDDLLGGLSFSPDGSRLASGSDDKTVKVWDTATGELLLTMTGHEDWINNLAYSPDGATIASVGGGYNLSASDIKSIIWDAATGEILHELPLQSENPGAWGIAYSPDSSLLATGDWLGSINIFDVASGALVRTIDNGEGADDVYFSPDGSRLIAGGLHGTMKIWDPITGQLLQEFVAHQNRTWGFAVSPDGKWIATGSVDTTARLWDAQSGAHLLTLEGHTGPIGDAEFTPDGTQLATTSFDGTVRFWVLSLDELVALAESRLTRSLTDEECQTYLHIEECSEDS